MAERRLNTGLGEKKLYTRRQIVDRLTKLTGTVDVLYTATLNKEKSKWTRGDEVEVTSDGEYITTKGNKTTRDNLGNLPACKDVMPQTTS